MQKEEEAKNTTTTATITTTTTATTATAAKPTTTGRNGRRSKNGCSTCRIRKVKCDEKHPVCGGCVARAFTCDWPGPEGVPEARKRRTRPAPPTNEPLPHTVRTLPVRKPLMPAPQTLRPSLYPNAIACSNSLRLSPRDRQLLHFFPDTDFFYVLSPRPWSPLNYISQHTAASSDIVMHMVLSLSALEFRHRNLNLAGAPPGLDLGLYHYTAALEKLRSNVSSASHLNQPNEEGLVTVLTALFFMIQYGLQAENMLHHVKPHALGLTGIIQSYLATMKAQDAPVSPLTSRLLLWIISSLIGSPVLLNHYLGAFDGLLNMLINPIHPCLDPQKLSEGARIRVKELWGDSYPQEYLVSDHEVLIPLALANSVELIHYRISKTRRDSIPEDERLLVYLSFMKDLLQMQETHKDVFFSKAANVSVLFESNHARQTAVKAVIHYWTTVLFCRRWVGDADVDVPLKRRAVAAIVDCAKDQYAIEKRRLIRFSRPLLFALIETDDPEWATWLSARLVEITQTYSGSRWCLNMATKIRQMETSRPNATHAHLDQLRQLPNANI